MASVMENGANGLWARIADPRERGARLMKVVVLVGIESHEWTALSGQG